MAEGAETACARIISVSTTTESIDRRFDFFREAICGVYCGIESRQSSDVVFDAAFSAYRLTGSVAAVMAAPGHGARRDARLIRRRPDESLFLNFSPVTPYQALLGDSAMAVQPGMPLLLDNRRPFAVDFATGPRMRLFSLRLPVDVLPVAEGERDVERINRAIQSSARGRQLALQMRLMCNAIDAGDLNLADLMSRPILHLLGLVARDGSHGNDADSLDLSAIKALARGHIDSSDFSLDHLAALMRCSARTVQTRFAKAQETFTGWLLAERLSLALDRLEDATSRGKSVEAIARSCGFCDASHFHRAFKRQYGVSPAAWRRAASS